MYRVIVVDDEILVREAICENINWGDLGFELVGNCENGKDAINFLKENDVDVVLTDICMPYLDGMQLSEYIYKNNPNTHIIIFSGFDEFEYAKKAIRYHVEEYMLKPITASELSEVLIKLKGRIDAQNLYNQKVNALRQSFYKNKTYLKSKALMNLMMGTQTKEENIKDLKDLDIELEAAGYRIAIINIIFSNKQNEYGDMKQQSALMQFVVFNISEEIVKNRNGGEVCLGNNNKVYIIFQFSGRKDMNLSNQICEEIIEKVLQFMGMSLTIAMGYYVNDLYDLSKSYYSAEKTLEFGHVLEDLKIIDVEKIENKRKETIEIAKEVEAICLAVRLNEKDKIKNLLTLVTEKIKSAYLEKNKAILYLQQIIHEIAEILQSNEMQNTQAYKDVDKYLFEIAMSPTLEAALMKVEQYSYKAGKEIAVNKGAGLKKYAVLAMDFIEKNYGNPELTLQYICNYLGISISRFSTLFKKGFGETFMEALIRIRMQKAKELIRNTDLKYYEIADKVGFSDPHYFSIAFKKVTGKTPTEYAREVR